MSDVTTEAGTVEPEGGAEGAATTESTTTPAAGGGDRLAEMFEQFTTQVGSRLDTFEQRLAPAEPAEPEDEELYLPEFDDDDYGEDGEITPEAQMRALAEIVNHVVEERERPIREAEAQRQRDEYADKIEEKYPKLQDPKYREKVIDETVKFAAGIGQPDLARDPRVLERVFLAMEAQERAEGETPAGSEQEVHLERPGAATPTGGTGEMDEGDRIVARMNGRHRLGSP